MSSEKYLFKIPGNSSRFGISTTGTTNPNLFYFLSPETTFICKLTMKDSTNFTFWHRDEIYPAYRDLLGRYTKEVGLKLLQYPGLWKRRRRFQAQVTRLASLANGRVHMTFHVYSSEYLPMSKKKKRETNEWNYLDFQREFLNALKSRAESPETFNDVTSDWLQQNAVKASSISVRNSGKFNSHIFWNLFHLLSIIASFEKIGL